MVIVRPDHNFFIDNHYYPVSCLWFYPSAGGTEWHDAYCYRAVTCRRKLSASV